MRQGQSGGPFAPIIIIFMLVFLVYLWSVIVPNAVAPGIDTSINATSGHANGDSVEFVLRMIPWAIPIILVIGFVWLMVKA
ncbi:hypothetical protein CCP3SC15_1440002 [Gammaproteobacteria bacterium]